jgi:hypothetical protein
MMTHTLVGNSITTTKTATVVEMMDRTMMIIRVLNSSVKIQAWKDVISAHTQAENSIGLLNLVIVWSI